MNKLVHRLAAVAFVAAVTTAALGTRAAAPAGHYTVSGSTVLDNKTKLTWQLATSATYSEDAAAYCNTFGAGWRVPTIKEILTLVDFTVTPPGPMIDKTFSSSVPSANPAFWSATVANPLTQWYVDFSTGTWTINDLGELYNVRCVK